MKTVRFTLVVKKCGAPEIYLAWVDPKRDKLLKRALNENRVMTLHQELHGGKKDFGTVGYLKDRHAQILLFPKSLRRFSDRRIIAVDYALFAKASEPVKSSAPLNESKYARQIPPKTPARLPSQPIANRIDEESDRPLVVKKTNSCRALAAGIIARQIKLAVNELAAGKSVPAYKRLVQLLAKMPSESRE